MAPLSSGREKLLATHFERGTLSASALVSRASAEPHVSVAGILSSLDLSSDRSKRLFSPESPASLDDLHPAWLRTGGSLTAELKWSLGCLRAFGSHVDEWLARLSVAESALVLGRNIEALEAVREATGSIGFSFVGLQLESRAALQETGILDARNRIDAVRKAAKAPFGRLVLQGMIATATVSESIADAETAIYGLVPTEGFRRERRDALVALLRALLLPANALQLNPKAAAAVLANLHLVPVIDRYFVHRKLLLSLVGAAGASVSKVRHAAGAFVREFDDSALSRVAGATLQADSAAIRLYEDACSEYLSDAMPRSVLDTDVLEQARGGPAPATLLAAFACGRARARKGGANGIDPRTPLALHFAAGEHAEHGRDRIGSTQPLVVLALSLPNRDVGLVAAALAAQLESVWHVGSSAQHIYFATGADTSLLLGLTADLGTLAAPDASARRVLARDVAETLASGTATTVSLVSLGVDAALASQLHAGLCVTKKLWRDAERSALEWNSEATTDASRMLSHVLLARIAAEEGATRRALGRIGTAYADDALRIERCLDLGHEATVVTDEVRSAAEALGWMFALGHNPAYIKRYGHIAVRGVLKAHGCTRPSQITVPPEDPSACPTAHFLATLCAPHVIDSLPLIASTTEQLLLERIAVCRMAGKLEPVLAEDMENEVAALEKRIHIERVLLAADRGRLSVNADGIRRSLGQSFTRELRQALLLGSLKTQVIIVSTQGADGALAESLSPASWGASELARLLARFRDEFLRSNEYGLEVSLSSEIRHGSMVHALRHPFEATGVLTSREGSQYPLPPGVTAHGHDVSPAFHDAYQRFALSVDTSLREFVSKRVRTVCDEHEQERTPHALMDYRITADDCERLLREWAPLAGSDDAVFDACLDYFWRRTADACASVKRALRGDLHPSLISATANLRDHGRILHPEVQQLLADTLVSAENSLDHAIGTVSSWFGPVSGAQNAPFSAEVLLESVLESTRRMHPDVGRLAEPEVTAGGQLSGSKFAPLFRSLSILVENAYSYSRETIATLVLTAMDEDDGKRISFTATHELASDLESRNVLSRLQYAANRDPNTVREEGNTGVLKLKKLLRVDIGDPTAQVRWACQDRQLTVGFSVSRDAVVQRQSTSAEYE